MKNKLAVTLSFILALFTANVNAADKTGQYTDEIVITITDQPCENKAKPHIVEQFLPLFQNGVALIDGKPFDLCWTSDPELVLSTGNHPAIAIVVVDEEGGYGAVPVEIFEKGHKPAKPNSF